MFVRLQTDATQKSKFGTAITYLYFQTNVFDVLSNTQCRVHAERDLAFWVSFSLLKHDLEEWIRFVDDLYGDVPEVHAYMNYIRLKIQEPAMAA